MDGTTTDYYYNGLVLIGMVTGSGSSAIVQRFSYDSSGNVVSVDYSTDNGSTFITYYYLRNGQGDVIKLIDGSGNTVVEYVYSTWGEQIACTGILATTVGINNPFRYRGYVYDVETGWYYLQSRFYNPETCRFISADIYLSTGQGVLGYNTYAYCLNNPANMSDPSGHKPNDECQEMTDGGSQNYKNDYTGRAYVYYSSIDDAAIVFARFANYITMSHNREVCAFIYQERYYDEETSQYRYRYYLSSTYVGEHNNVIADFLRHGSSPNVVGMVHTHPYCIYHSHGTQASFSTGDRMTTLFSGWCYCSDVSRGELRKIRFNPMSVFKYGFGSIPFSQTTSVTSGLPVDTTIYNCK